MRHHARPRVRKFRRTGARLERHIQLGAGRIAAPLFFDRTGARIKTATTLMQVSDDDTGIILVGVEDPIAVVRIDIHVGHALKAVSPAQRLDHHAAVIEDAESCRLCATGVMQSSDGHERASLGPGKNPLHRRKTRPDHAGGGFVDAAKRRRIAAIEAADAAFAVRAHKIQVFGFVKEFEVGTAGFNRIQQRDPGAQTLAVEFTQEGPMPVRPKRMSFRESVTGQPLADDYGDLRCLRVHSLCPSFRSSGCARRKPTTPLRQTRGMPT